MLIKTFLIITLFAFAVSAYSDSSENFESNDRTVDCDSFYAESGDYLLGNFISKHDLQYDYDRRNDSYEECFHFLSKFSLLVDEFKKEVNSKKRAYKIRPKSVFKYKF